MKRSPPRMKLLSETENLDRTMECANPMQVGKVGASGRGNKAL